MYLYKKEYLILKFIGVFHNVQKCKNFLVFKTNLLKYFCYFKRM